MTTLAMPIALVVTTPLDLILVRAWHIQDADALAIIVGSTTDGVLPHLHMVGIAFEAWTILQDMYELNNKEWILDLETKLFGMGMNEGSLVQEHITKMKVL